MKTVAFLNLMPNKIETERQWLHIVNPARHELIWQPFLTASYRPKSTPLSTLVPRYAIGLPKDVDILVVTGAPLGQKSFSKVDYWPELKDIFKFCIDRKIPIFASCWAAHAYLHAIFELPITVREEKLFGVFTHQKVNSHQITSQLPEQVSLPHSRYASIPPEELFALKSLTPLLVSEQTGPSLIFVPENQTLLLLGHPEYASDTLFTEYQRDRKRGLNTALPAGIDDRTQRTNSEPEWQLSGQRIFSNWLEYLRGG